MQLYDGTRLYVGAGTVTFPFDVWSAERIEVLRGPTSVLYGEGAIGGVVNFVPKKPASYYGHEREVAVGTMQRDGSGSVRAARSAIRSGTGSTQSAINRMLARVAPSSAAFARTCGTG
jgi:outer membrane receptor protein involved in Fe transport